MFDIITQLHHPETSDDRFKFENSNTGLAKGNEKSNSMFDVNSPDFSPGLHLGENLNGRQTGPNKFEQNPLKTENKK
jgi:hypothetical protein